MIVRPFREGEEPALFEVYFSAIHLVAKRDYSLEQLNAWAPRDLDPQLWAENGYIDHFFVSGYHPRQGIRAALMDEVLRRAAGCHARELSSDVSRTAQPFFERFGFEVVRYNSPVVRNVAVPYAFMRRSLQN